MTEPDRTQTPLPFMRVDALTKSFGPVEVLHNIALNIVEGEVHALIGENGAGKSTLMKILAGHLQPSGGRIFIDEQLTNLSGPVEAEQRGIVLIHQEILLAPDMSVAQNIFLGREISKGMILNDRLMNEQARAAIASLGADIDPRKRVEQLSIAQRQLVQIARALLVPHRLVIFDEPTASLTPIETDALLKVILAIRDRGAAVLYISHRLPEVKTIADRITVLRDGNLIASHPASDLEPLDMAHLMVGRDMSQLYPDHQAVVDKTPVLQVSDFHVPAYASNCSFTLNKGEILGFAGLIGAGRTELFEAIVGLRPGHGSIQLHGKKVSFGSARDSMAAGIVYLSEDRKGKGLLLAQDLQTNLTLASLEKFTNVSLINRGREREALTKAISDFDIRTRNPDLLAGQLSGGNQQKLLLAKMMLLNPDIIIIDEPTRGIDIGTKEQIYSFIAKLAESGKSVIVISSEMPELIGICDRILVMRNGEIVAEISGDQMNENEIVIHATGVTSREAAALAEVS